MKIYIIFGMIALTGLALGAKKCYDCENCPEPFIDSHPNVTIEECPSDSYKCVKSTQRLPLVGTYVNKRCVTGDCKPLNGGYYNFGVFLDCCETDLCNHSMRYRMTNPTFFFTLVIIILNKFFI